MVASVSRHLVYDSCKESVYINTSLGITPGCLPGNLCFSFCDTVTVYHSVSLPESLSVVFVGRIVCLTHSSVSIIYLTCGRSYYLYHWEIDAKDMGLKKTKYIYLRSPKTNELRNTTQCEQCSKEVNTDALELRCPGLVTEATSDITTLSTWHFSLQFQTPFPSNLFS